MQQRRGVTSSEHRRRSRDSAHAAILQLAFETLLFGLRFESAGKSSRSLLCTSGLVECIARNW
jgi:hypothetical protein